MHLYEGDRDDAKSLIGEGYQSRVEMPPMPTGDPWPAIAAVLQAEARAATGEIFDADEAGLDPYWSDLIRMVQVYFCDDDQQKKALRDAMSFRRYRPYITSRIGRSASLRRSGPEQ
jgi:thymidylate synthase